MFHFSYPFFVKRLDTCIKRFINVIYYYYYYYYYLFIVKRFDHIIGKRYISTCYVCMMSTAAKHQKSNPQNAQWFNQ